MENMLKIFGADSKERVESTIEELQVGKGVLLIDNEDRENGGELMNDNGTISRFSQIVVFALKHDLMALSIEAITQYRQMHTSDNLLKENILQ
ncbi:MAG: hypothetical protein ACN6OB_13875 [Chryseobacterium jejuense]|uniref:hypothetical protein n=1 Tax=Chryseobacterium jejuense TaxID=445960 RepID=UPI003D0F1AAB